MLVHNARYKGENDTLFDNEYNRQAKKYGKGGIKDLGDGRVRFYGEIKPASKPGEMAGARLVREWNTITGTKRTWYETLDHEGRIRKVRPNPFIKNGVKVHYLFDAFGNYVGRWSSTKEGD